MIDYSLIHQASEYYSNLDYLRIESPWLVTREINDLTRPSNASRYLVQKDNEDKIKTFVASGEQSFLYLINKGFLPKRGKFHTITPCMRNDSFDETHTKYFMKLELIRYSTASITDINNKIQKMVGNALEFFKQHVDDSRLQILELKETSEFSSYDIMLDNIEIGSYGYRECLFCNWIYGTGLAEPRFSRLIKHRGA